MYTWFFPNRYLGFVVRDFFLFLRRVWQRRSSRARSRWRLPSASRLGVHTGAVCIFSRFFESIVNMRTHGVPPSIVDHDLVSVYGQRIACFCRWFGDGTAADFAACVRVLCPQCRVCGFVLKLCALSVFCLKSNKCDDTGSSTVDHR